MTPDAYAVGDDLIENLIKPLINHSASITYARQIPHDGADFFESFPREFNYPNHGQIRSIQDVSEHGVYTFFCSDTCAAYWNHALDEIGGFSPVLFGEDTIVVAKLLKAGHKIAYVAEAIVKHSHRYSLKKEFQRHFDIGLARNECRELLRCAGKDSQRGKEFVKQMMNKLMNEQPYLLPYACAQVFVKYVGYLLGMMSVNAPLFWKKWWSSQDFYWVSEYCHMKETQRGKGSKGG
jgi:rhamnosyltransferase